MRIHTFAGTLAENRLLEVCTRMGSPSLFRLRLSRTGALVLGLVSVLFLLHQLLFQLAGIGLYWWWIFWGDAGNLFLTLGLWLLTAYFLLLWFSSRQVKDVSRKRRRHSPLLVPSLIMLVGIACCMLLCSAITSYKGFDFIGEGPITHATYYFQKATLSYQGVVYHLTLKSVDPEGAVDPQGTGFNIAYAVDLYQCDGSGWFCQRVQADMGRGVLADSVDSYYLSPDEIYVQMHLDISHTHLQICIVLLHSARTNYPGCIYSYPLPQTTAYGNGGLGFITNIPSHFPLAWLS